MTKGNGKAPGGVSIQIPQGVPPAAVEMLVYQLQAVFAQWAPLMPREHVLARIQESVSLIAPIMQHTERVRAALDAPGATWGVSLHKQAAVVGAPRDPGIGFDVALNPRAAAQDINDFMRWLGVYSLVMHPDARALAGAYGFAVGLRLDDGKPKTTEAGQ